MNHDSSKSNIAIGFYKHILENKINKYNNIDTIYSRDKFENHVTHTDLLRLLQQKLITKDVYDVLFKEIKH